MDYQGFTDDSLVKMYEGVGEALAADETLRQLGQDGRFRVRTTPAWKLHAADLEAEMARRRISFTVIDWYQADPSVQETPAPSAVPEDMQGPPAAPEEIPGPPAAPEQSPPEVEPSRSQQVLESLSAVDVPGVSPSAPPGRAKEKPAKKRRTKAAKQLTEH
jgi:hypothetical protein